MRPPTILLLLSILLPLSSQARAEEFDGLPMPGTPAPPLVVSQWLRGGPVTEWRPGHIYIVDLWSTWCRPCVATFPLLSRMQERYTKDITIIGVNVWEFNPGGVPEFMEAHRDSMAFAVATDSLPPGKEVNEGITAVAYLGTSEQVSIPQTFLIDREGHIAWVGLPDDLEEPLSQIVNGTWDVKPFAATYEVKMRGELRYRKLLAPVEAAIAARDWEQALKLSEAVVSADSSFAPRVANQGFAYIAMMILKMKSPSLDDFKTARRAIERSLELQANPDWQSFEMAARAAWKSEDRAAARKFFASALERVPDEERAGLQLEMTAFEKEP